MPFPTNFPGAADNFTDQIDIYHADVINAIEKILLGPMHFNVKGYGATGNGVSDDTAAIAAAITAAAAVAPNGAEVFFPPGTYLHSGLTLPQFVSLRGSGMNSTVVKYTGAGIAINGTTDWSFGRISDIQFSCSGTPASYCFSNHNVTRDYTFERVRIGGHLGCFDLWQSINTHARMVYTAGQGGLVAGGIAWKFGNGATAATTTTLEDCYITDIETGVRNELCPGLVLIRPIFENYKFPVYSLSKTLILWPWLEAGVAGHTGLHSEDTMIVIGGTYDSVAADFASVGAARFTSIAGFEGPGKSTFGDAVSIRPAAGAALPPTNYGTIRLKIDEQSPSAAGSVRIPASGSLVTGFRNLRITWKLRDTVAAVAVGINLRFNGDSGSNYVFDYVQSLGTVVSGNETNATPTTAITAGIYPGSTAPANNFGVGEIVIYDYNSSTEQKAVTFVSYDRETTGAAGLKVTSGGGTWLSTAAITSITFTANTAINGVIDTYGEP